MKLRKIGLLVAGASMALGTVAATVAVAGTAGAVTRTPTASTRPSWVPTKQGNELWVRGKGYPANQTVVATECGTGAPTDPNACNMNQADLGKPGGPALLGTSGPNGGILSQAYTVAFGTIGDSTCNSGDTCYIALVTLSSLSPPTVSASVLVPIHVKVSPPS